MVRSLIAVLALGALIAGPALAEKAWDAKKMEKLTAELVQQTLRLQNAVARHVDPDATKTPQWVAVQGVHGVHEQALALETSVRAGLPKVQTELVYQHLESSIELARKSVKLFPEIAEQRKLIDVCDKLVDEIGEYYDD